MLLIDGHALLPPYVRLLSETSDWADLLRTTYGDPEAHVILETRERFAWLRRLSSEDIWSEIRILTTAAEFPFWRLAPQRVEVQDPYSGTGLTAAKRTRDLNNWAAGVIARSSEKRLIAAVPPGRLVGLLASLATAEDTAAEDTDLLPSSGTYTPVDITSLSQIRREILAHIEAGGTWCWDTETESTGEDDDKAPNPIETSLVGVSIAIRPGEAWYFPVNHRDPETDEPQPWNLPTAEVLQLIQIAVANTGAVKGRWVGHNIKYDLGVMTNPVQNLSFGWAWRALDCAEDTMLMAQVGCFPRAGLKPLAETELHEKVLNFRKLTRGKSFAYVPLRPATIYAGQDADWPLRLLPILRARLDSLEVEHVYREAVIGTEYFMRIERRGVHVNRQRLEATRFSNQQNIDFAEKLFRQTMANAGIELPDDFNMSSTDQLRPVLFDPQPAGLGLRILQRTPTGAAATGEKVINDMIAQGIDHPALRILIAWRGYRKLEDAFLRPISQLIRADGRVHANYRQTPAETGRTACHDPNMQQLEKSLRAIFDLDPDEDTEGEGECASIDYSQVELRVLAAWFTEPKMLETFNLPRFVRNPETGKWEENPEADIHGRTQREVGLPNRTKAKNFNFGKAFGAQAATLSQTAAMPRHVVEAFIRRFDEAYQSYTTNLRAEQQKVRETLIVRDWHGRCRVFQEPRTRGEEAELNRFVSNTPVQMGAADIIKWAMRELLPLLREVEQFGIYPTNMVHDELDFEWTGKGGAEGRARWEQFLRDAAEIMKRCNPFAHLVPLDVDIEVGRNWKELRAPEFLSYDMDDAELEVEGVTVA